MGPKSFSWLVAWLSVVTATVLLIMPWVQADDFLAQAFRPLEGLDLGSFYDKHHPWVDFTVYLVLFVSLAQMTLGKRFGGRPGRAAALGVGLALAVALAAMERSIGFSLRSLGPLAAAILLVIVGSLVFNLARQMSLGISTSASVALVLVYFLVRATTPNFFLWLETNRLAAWLNLALVMAVLVALWNLASLAFRRRAPDLSTLGEGLVQASRRPTAVSPAIEYLRLAQRETQEAQAVKGRLQALTRKSAQDGQEIIALLQEMIRIIREFGHDPRARALIARRLQEIAPREAAIRDQLARLGDLDLRLERFDWRSFKELRARLAKASPQERDKVKEEILAEKKKLLVEERIREFRAAFERYDKGFRESLTAAVERLQDGQPAQSVDWLERAVKEEEGAVRVVQEMKRIEEELGRLTEIEAKVAGKEK